MWYINLRTTDGPGASVGTPDQATCVHIDPVPGHKISRTGHPPFHQRFSDIRREIGDRTLVLAVHGFNVGLKDGFNSLAGLSSYLHRLGDLEDYCVVGVLWPGDYYHLAVNYTWEHQDAVQAGEVLSQIISRHFSNVSGINFITHSLGARVALTCLQKMGPKPEVDQVILTAPACDNTVFRKQYASVLARAKRFRVLASRADRVLKWAYPPGDFIADLLLKDDDSPLVEALGRSGAARPIPPEVSSYQIEQRDRQRRDETSNFDHGDYFPNIVPVENATRPPQHLSAEDRKDGIKEGIYLDPPSYHAAMHHYVGALRGVTVAWPPIKV